MSYKRWTQVDAEIAAEQGRLNELYDAFTAKHGLISSRENKRAFEDDSSYYLLCSLEILDEDGRLEKKSDMFTKRTIQPHRPVEHTDTTIEAPHRFHERACACGIYITCLSSAAKARTN